MNTKVVFKFLISFGIASQALGQEFTKLMIFPGESNIVELIDLESENRTCQQPIHFPGYTAYAAAFIDGKPFACKERDCYWYDKASNGWIQDERQLKFERFNPGYVQVDEESFWVAGGRDDPAISTSDLFTVKNGWQSSIDFFNVAGIKIYDGSCVLKINETHYFLTAGDSDSGLDESYIMDATNPIYPEFFTLGEIPGASANRAACGIVTRPGGAKEIVVAGGGSHSGASGSGILSLADLSWRQGPYLPYMRFKMASVQHGDTFLAIGGRDTDGFHMDYYTILKYDPINDSWIELSQRLKSGGSRFAATLVADESVNC